MKTQIVRVEGKLAVNTAWGYMFFQNYADAQTFIRTQRTLKISRQVGV